jgi:hypothetical protein
MRPFFNGITIQRRDNPQIETMLKAVSLFMETSFHERALEVLEELRDLAVDDFKKLAVIARLEGQCYDSIVTKERPVLNRFYGVRFFGQFSAFFGNQLFVYRRDGFYMANQMAQELRDRFPGATVEFAPPSQAEQEQCYIYVFNVKPLEDRKGFDPWRGGYRQLRPVNKFYSEAPVRVRRTDVAVNEMAEWHRHIVTYETAGALQGIARRSRVVRQSDTRVMRPIECAICDTADKTIELMDGAARIWRDLRFGRTVNPAAVSSLARLLHGVVVAAINGGTRVFQQSFLEGPLSGDADVAKHRNELTEVFRDHVKAIRFALDVHRAAMGDAERLLHVNWEENFEAAKETMRSAVGVIDFGEKPHFGEIPSVKFLPVL